MYTLISIVVLCIINSVYWSCGSGYYDDVKLDVRNFAEGANERGAKGETLNLASIGQHSSLIHSETTLVKQLQQQQVAKEQSDIPGYQNTLSSTPISVEGFPTISKSIEKDEETAGIQKDFINDQPVSGSGSDTSVHRANAASLFMEPFAIDVNTTTIELLIAAKEGRIILTKEIIAEFVATKPDNSISNTQLCQFAELGLGDELLVALAQKAVIIKSGDNPDTEKLCQLPDDAIELMISNLPNKSITVRQLVSLVEKQKYSNTAIKELASKADCSFEDMADHYLKLYKLPKDILGIMVAQASAPKNGSTASWRIYKLFLGGPNGEKYNREIIEILASKMPEISFADLDPMFLEIQRSGKKIADEDMNIILKKLQFSKENREWEKEYLQDQLRKSGYKSPFI
jgi:hypothetical protein